MKEPLWLSLKNTLRVIEKAERNCKLEVETANKPYKYKGPLLVVTL